MVLMIIKGLFRRYERWNPVHPTSGPFWGMGIGVGCGIGWGPGFGPEVIGYVGAGCGVGFSVGITFAGFGIGLPANFLFEVPYNAFIATRNVTRNGWNNAEVNSSGLQRRFSSFKHQQSLNKNINLSGMNSLMSSNSRLVLDYFDKLKSRFVHPR